MTRLTTLEREHIEREAAELRAEAATIEGHARAMKDIWRGRIESEPNEAVRSVMNYAEGALFDWASDHLFAWADRCEDEAGRLVAPIEDEDRAEMRSDYYAGVI